MNKLKLIAQNHCFGGTQFVYSHAAASTQCEMRFGVYLPPHAELQKLPCLISAWEAYDPIALVTAHGWSGTILIDQGTQDEFLPNQLHPELFESACQNAAVKLQLRRQVGYDHSYYFIATFIEDHLRFHFFKG